MLDAVLRRHAPYVREMLPRANRLKSKPAVLVYGVHDYAILSSRQIADFKAMWPGGPIIRLPNAGHFSQEDAPGTIVALLQHFIQTT
jgi:cis-3-alkyl-4-acyloxetan-2-one decarboxylase